MSGKRGCKTAPDRVYFEGTRRLPGGGRAAARGPEEENSHAVLVEEA